MHKHYHAPGHDLVMLRRGPVVWEAIHHGPNLRTILDLFGTGTLPTPYGVGMPAYEVGNAILNASNAAGVDDIEVGSMHLDDYRSR